MSPRWNCNTVFTTASLRNDVVASLVWGSLPRQVLPKLLLATVAGLEGGISRGLGLCDRCDSDSCNRDFTSKVASGECSAGVPNKEAKDPEDA